MVGARTKRLEDGQLRHKQWEGIAGNKLGHKGLVTWGRCGTGDSENLNLSSAEGVEHHGSIGVPISLGPSSSDLFAQMPISAVSETRPPGPLSSCTDVPHKSMASDVSVHCGDDNGQAPPQYGALLPSTSCLPPSHGGTAPLPIVLLPPLAPLPLAQNQLPAQQHLPPLHQMQPLQPHHQVHQHQLPPPSIQQSPVTIRPQQVSTSPLPPPPHVQLQVMHCMQGSPFSTMAPPPPLMQVPPPLPLGQTEGSSWGRLFLPRVPEQQQPPPPPPMYIAQKPVEELYDPLADGLDDGTSLRLPAEEALLKDVMPLSQDGPGSLPAKEWSPPAQLHQGGFRQEAMTEVVTTIDLSVPVEVVKVAASSPTANASAVKVAEAAPGGAITVDTVRSDAISPVALKQKDSKGILLLRNSVADVVKELLKPTWKEGHMSREAFKIIARKAVDKVVGAVSPHAVPKNQRGVDAFLTGSRKDKIGKLVQGYVEKYVKA